MNTPKCNQPVESLLNVLGDNGGTWGVCLEHYHEAYQAIHRVVGAALLDEGNSPDAYWEETTCQISYILNEEFPQPDLEKVRYLMVLDDGETYSALEGCRIVEVAADATAEEIEAKLAAIRASGDTSGTFSAEPPPITRPYS